MNRTAPNLDRIRECFPALSADLIYFENAGGSQLPSTVIDAYNEYFIRSFVQLGATYGASVKATSVVDDAHKFSNILMNGEGIGMTVIGHSTTQLISMIADCYSQVWQPGDEVIICETAHEANAGPWEKLNRFGIVVKTWKVEPTTFQCSLADLESLLTERTKLVAFPHVSNLLGEVVNVEAITKLVHSKGAKVMVDGVAYASHRAVDVRAWGVDWYVFSTYKVFGPHQAVMFGTSDAFSEIEGPNHFFLPNGNPYKFELGGANHEACAGILGMGEYLKYLSGSDAVDRDCIETAFDLMSALEAPLQTRLVDFLSSRPGVKLIGPGSNGAPRVPTVSFIHESLSPFEIVDKIVASGIAVRNGNMYAYRLCRALGIDPASGVVRVSMVHYNTLGEVERLLEVLDSLL